MTPGHSIVCCYWINSLARLMHWYFVHFDITVPACSPNVSTTNVSKCRVDCDIFGSHCPTLDLVGSQRINYMSKFAQFGHIYNSHIV